MDRDIAVALLDQLHAAQNEFYGGGGDALLRDLLASDIAGRVTTTARSWREDEQGQDAGRNEMRISQMPAHGRRSIRGK